MNLYLNWYLFNNKFLENNTKNYCKINGKIYNYTISYIIFDKILIKINNIFNIRI